MAGNLSKNELLHLYRRLLRSSSSYPSKNAAKIVQSIREDFRENKGLDPESEKAQKQRHIALQGLHQLKQFDNRGSSVFAVTLEQNPFPKPAQNDNENDSNGGGSEEEGAKR